MSAKKDDIPEVEDTTATEEDAAESIPDGIEAPTSNDVGEQTLTKADYTADTDSEQDAEGS